MAQFGDLLAELRQDKKLTQKQLAKIIYVSSGTICNSVIMRIMYIIRTLKNWLHLRITLMLL